MRMDVGVLVRDEQGGAGLGGAEAPLPIAVGDTDGSHLDNVVKRSRQLFPSYRATTCRSRRGNDREGLALSQLPLPHSILASAWS